ncbi:MAG: GGDEF domain-containing protein [Planctomycetota bacterium]
MSKDQLVEILKLCFAIDQRAEMAYARFAEAEKRRGLKQFWRKMSETEGEHVQIWKRLLDMARENMLPQVFDQPKRVAEELKSTRDKINEMANQCVANPDPSCAFLLAYRMEFYVMRHPAFATLLNFIQTISEEKNLEEEYDAHINAFVEALVKYGRVTPEMEMLGETLQHLWKENCALARQTTTDDLTGVLNRRGFFLTTKPLAHLAQRQGAAVGILMADIDNFKEINDTLGHPKGDEVLRMMGDILRRRMRASDLVGRYGGEEFIVFLPMIKKASLRRIAEGIRKRVESETKKKIHLTVSIGAAEGMLGDDVDRDFLALVKKADACLYEAKRRGKNVVVMENA